MLSSAVGHKHGISFAFNDNIRAKVQEVNIIFEGQLATAGHGPYFLLACHGRLDQT